MTRLREEDVRPLGAALHAYHEGLIKKIGKNLMDIAATAVGKTASEILPLREGVRVGVVPMTCGQGVIGGFSEAVRAIIDSLGFYVFVAEKPDVGGIAEVVERGAHIVFLADDDDFVAVRLQGNVVVHNGEATGRGYAAALSLMVGDLAKKDVLVIGAGPVGAGAAAFLAKKGAAVMLFDVDKGKADGISRKIAGVKVISALSDAFPACNLVVEATPAVDVIPPCYITESTCIAAPGVPLGLSDESLRLVQERMVHDVLEIGVASMLITALAA